MKTKTILLLCSFVCLMAQAQSTYINHRLNFVGNAASTNFTVGPNVLFRIVTGYSHDVTNGTFGVQFPGGPMMEVNLADIGEKLHENPVLGPCTVRVTAQGDTQVTAMYLLAQYETVNTTLPAQGVIVQPAGSGATIQLQTSTNLTSWRPATNGVYPRTDLNRFFRMSLISP